VLTQDRDLSNRKNYELEVAHIETNESLIGPNQVQRIYSNIKNRETMEGILHGNNDVEPSNT
jgi:hypothetical protein